MGRVVVGPEHDVPETAGAIAHGLEEASTRVVCWQCPVARDADPAAIGQHEGRHVERIRRRVLAALRAGFMLSSMADVSARVAAEVLDGRDARAEDRLGRGLQRMTLPHRHRHGRRTGENEWRAHSLGQCGNANRVGPAAAAGDRSIRHRREGQRGGIERCGARRWIGAEPPQLVERQQVGKILRPERRPWVPSIWKDDPLFREGQRDQRRHRPRDKQSPADSQAPHELVRQTPDRWRAAAPSRGGLVYAPSDIRPLSCLTSSKRRHGHVEGRQLRNLQLIHWRLSCRFV